MAANNELSEIERDVLRYILMWETSLTAEKIRDLCSWGPASEVNQAIANLVAKGYIIGSVSFPIVYSAAR